MKLTPLDIRHKEFRRAMRGYSDEDVDLFLDEVADEFERLFQDNIEARERVEQLEETVRHHESLKETLQKTLVSAQQQADGTLTNARKEAELILKDAEIKGRDLVNESYAEKQRVQQALTQLKQVEEDFRFKFRSLLEAHLNLLSEDEISEERKRFRGLVAGIEADPREGRGPGGAPQPAQPPAPTQAPQPSAASPAARQPEESTSGVAGAPGAAATATPVAAGSARVDAATPPDAFAEAESFLEGLPVAMSEETEGAAPASARQEPAAEARAAEPAPPDPGDGDTEGGHYHRPESRSLLEFDDDPESTVPAYDDLEEDRRGARAQRKDSSVRRFLFGRKDAESDDEGDFFDEPEDRDFRW